MPNKPKKSTGGYITLDLGGIDIAESGVNYEITDPNLLKILRALGDYDICKPIYITNFLLDGNRFGPIPMILAGDSLDELVSMYPIPDVESITISLEEAPTASYVTYTQA